MGQQRLMSEQTRSDRQVLINAVTVQMKCYFTSPVTRRIIKGRPLEVDFDRRINVYNKEHPHE